MNDWLSMNQHYLVRALAEVRHVLERHAEADLAVEADAVPDEPVNAAANLAPPALESLCSAFSLSPFERDILLMCAGVELESGFAALCGRAQRQPGRTYATFSLAIAALRSPHWSALSPDAPLRRWRLIEPLPREEAVTAAPLRIAERVLHFVTGVRCEDEELRGLIRPIEGHEALPPSQQEAVEEIVRVLARARPGSLPLIQLCGRGDGDKQAIAVAACERLGLGLAALRSAEVPLSAGGRLQLARLWERESTLTSRALLIETSDGDAADISRAVTALSECIYGVVLIAIREPSESGTRPAVRIAVERPRPVEQLDLWHAALGPVAAELNGALDNILSHFDLTARHVRVVSAQAMLTQGDEETLEPALWNACRAETRPRLEGLAQRIAPAASWSDLVLPEAQVGTLREIAAQLRGRHQVYESWGFATKGSRGLGITALFSGGSGTGKTFAAEVLAAEMRLDLYRIDLSQVVSKYIGETEKNLRRVFDAAEGSGSILLFDEADALFGKRSEVKDSHDRFANIEISYLLQRMEAYRGLAILTTNLKQALDAAFLRRIRFVVSFPFPGMAERAELWRRVFPAATPTENLNVNRLARLNVTGGNIRNIALNAAFSAASEGASVRMDHLLRAAHREYEKLEKPLTESETGGWV